MKYRYLSSDSEIMGSVSQLQFFTFLWFSYFTYKMDVLLIWSGASLVAQTVMRLLTMRETWVRSLGREDPLEKGMTTHSSIRAWKIPWTKEPGGLQSMGSQRVRHDWMTSLHFTYMITLFWSGNWLLHNKVFRMVPGAYLVCIIPLVTLFTLINIICVTILTWYEQM